MVADRQRIEQVLINLLSNAVKYSPGEQQVVVNCKESNGEAVVEVRDFGPGMTEVSGWSPANPVLHFAFH